MVVVAVAVDTCAEADEGGSVVGDVSVCVLVVERTVETVDVKA